VIKDITLGQFFPGRSIVHRLDPRTKVLLTMALIVIVFFCQNIFSLLLMIAFVAAVNLLSRIPLKIVLKSVKPIVIIVIFTAVLNLLYTDDGRVLLSFWVIKITDKGIETAVFMAIRIILLIVSSSLLTYTTSPTQLTDALERLMSPLKVIKVPVHSIAMMMTIALRFIPTLVEEIERIMNAQKARGADMESGNLIKRAKALVPVLIPLFISSFRRAGDLAFAMECRCYDGDHGRTRMQTMKFAWRDLGALIAVCLLLTGIILLNIYVPDLT